MTYVLIVEDDPDLRALVVTLLRRQYAGLYIETASRITEAHNLLLHQAPWDLVIVDGHLPDGEGAHLVECLHKAYIGPPCIGMSGDPAALEELGMAGCRAVLGKPFSADQLYEAIDGIFAQGEEEDFGPELGDAGLPFDQEPPALRRVLDPEEDLHAGP